MDNSKYLKQKITYGDIVADFDGVTLVVNYTVEASTLDDYGETVHTKSRDHQQKIRLKDLNENSNIPLYAQNIADRCEFIHESQLPQVVDRLYALQAHLIEHGRRADSAKALEREARRKRKEERRRAQLAARRDAEEKKRAEEVATMDSIDDYLEQLCDEDMELKMRGTSMLLQLARNVTNLGVLIQQEAMLSALTRVLKEDYKKSQPLALNIMQIFFNFSVFEEMHPTLLSSRVGDLTMKVVDLESRRHSARMDELRRLARLADAQKRGDKELEAKIRAGEEDGAQPEKQPDKRAKRKGKDRPKKVKKLPKTVDIEKEKRKMKAVMRSQEQLLYVCFCVLLNLAHDEHIRRKMIKRGIIKYLVPLLDRENPKLLLLVTNFLRALPTCMEEMGRMGVVEKLAKFVPNNLELLLRAVLRLLYNLSFEPGNRDIMVQNGLLRKLVSLLKLPPFRAVTIRLLYHISMDDRAKSEFTYTEAVPLVMQLIIHFPAPVLAKELIALGVNLSLNARNADLMAQGDGLTLLMRRLLKTHDPMLMKMIRNISQWSHNLQADLAHDAEYKQEGLWAPYVRDLFRLCRNERVTPELLVEVLGTLANLTTRDLPEDVTYADLITEYGFVHFLYKLLVPGFAEDDIVLEVIMLVGVIAAEPNCASIIAGSKIIRMLDNALTERQSDPEIVLQTLFTFFRLLHQPQTAEVVIYDTAAVTSMCDAVNPANNPEIVRVAEQCLDYVIDFDMRRTKQIAARVQQIRYEQHNRQFLAMMESEMSEEAETKRWMQGDVDESEASGSYGESGQWGGVIQGNHEAVAMDMAMLGDYDDSEMGSPSVDGSPGAGGRMWSGAGAGAGAGAGGGGRRSAGSRSPDESPQQWATGHPQQQVSWGPEDYSRARG